MSDAGPNGGNGNTNDDENGGEIDSATLNRLLKALANQRRRTILYTLEDRSDDVISLDELVDVITSQDTEFDNGTQNRVVLHHRDLPKLEDARLLEYDSRNGAIRYRGGDVVEEFIDVLEDFEQ